MPQGQTPEQIQEKKEQLSQRRWKDAENGEPEYIPSFPEEPVSVIPDEIQGLPASVSRLMAPSGQDSTHILQSRQVPQLTQRSKSRFAAGRSP